MRRKSYVLIMVIFAGFIVISCPNPLVEDNCTNHIWDAYTVTNAATCTTQGEQTATCTHPNCNEVNVQPVPALNHAWGAFTVTNAATCTTQGEQTATCTYPNCNEVNVHSVPVLPHDWQYAEGATEATCTEPGSGERYCINCTAESTGGPYPALGHNFGAWLVTLPATVEEDGEETRICQYHGCDETEHRPIYTNGTPGLSFSLVNGNSYSVSKGMATDAEIVFPAIYKGLPVTTIGSFANYTAMTSIFVPDTVTSISQNAFQNCSSMTSVTVDANNPNYSSHDGILYNKAKTNFIHIPIAISGSVTIPSSINSIGSNAFRNCTNLTSIVIPDSVQTIGSNAFNGCTGLTSITIPFVGNTLNGTSNTHFGYIFGAQSVSGQNSSIPASLKTVTITGGNSIGENAFNGCTSLTSISIGSGVTSIGGSAFSGCTGLTSITIPNSVTSIGNYAFRGSTSLTSVTIPNSVTSIGDFAFALCTGLTSITIGSGVTSIGSYAFYQCTGLTSVTIGNSVTTISNYAFENCTSLTSIIIPNSVTSIGRYAFLGCTGLTSITIPFVGNTLNGTSNTHFGYIFGASSYDSQNSSIPASLKTVTITGGNSIRSNAFRGCTSLTSVAINSGATSIDTEAFRGCTSLTSVTIPNSVTSIGNYAFSGCTSLTSVTIPNSVTSIGNYVFSGCTSFATITVDTSNPNYSSQNGVLYNKTKTTLILAPKAISGSFTIPNSVTSIGVLAFFGCASLTSVIIPNSVTYIDWAAFSGCTSLTSVSIPNSVTSIGQYAFEGCTSLTSITIPFVGESLNGTSNTYFGWIFDGVPTSLKTVTITGGNSIGQYAFSGRTGLTSITIPSSVTSIGEGAFYGCTGLTNITIGNSVTSIGWRAFEGCTGLTSISIPFVGESLNGTSNTRFSFIFGALSDNSQHLSIPASLKTVTITGGNSIEVLAFLNCLGLTTITIPSSVTSIGEEAFLGCASLTSITVDTNNQHYSSQDGILYNKTKTTLIRAPGGIRGSVTIPSGVTSIGDGAFSYCTNLASVTIPNSVTSIGWSAFDGCTGLTSVTIPSSVTNLYSDKFLYCNSLTTITVDPNNPNYSSQNGVLYNKTKTTLIRAPGAISGSFTIPSGVTSIGSNAFYQCTSLTSVTIPNSVTSIGVLAFSGCTNLASVTIPNSVTSIGDSAFNYCTGLTSVTFNGTITSANLHSEAFGTSGYYSYIGDLRAKYLAGGIGTYYCTSGSGNSAVWTKF